MPLAPELVPLLEQLGGLPQLETLSPGDARAVMTALSKAAPPGPQVAVVRDDIALCEGAQVPVRVYADSADCDTILLYLHGGGWTVGWLDSVDGLLREWVSGSRLCIVSVDYRLAPEAPFPSALEDAWSALRWADAARGTLASPDAKMVVGGESAGANLAIGIAVMARDLGGPAIHGQLLFYPVTDADFETASYREYGQGYFLTRSMMQWFWDQYMPETDLRSDARASPLRIADASRLPATLLQTAEFDPLRDEGEAFGKRLAAAGVDVTVDRRNGLIHGFLAMREVDAARDAFAAAKLWLSHLVSR